MTIKDWFNFNGLKIATEKMNILFVCSRNKWRSRTAEDLFKGNNEHHVKSAGTEPSAKITISAKQIVWADIIFVMEKKHRQRLLEKFPIEIATKEIVILDIEDDYKYMDEELVETLKTSVEPYLN